MWMYIYTYMFIIHLTCMYIYVKILMQINYGNVYKSAVEIKKGNVDIRWAAYNFNLLTYGTFG